MEPQEKTSEWDISLQTMYRIGNELQQFNFLFKAGEYSESLECLRVLEMEVDCFLSKDEKKEFDKLTKQLTILTRNAYRQGKPNQQLLIESKLMDYNKGLRKALLKYNLYCKIKKDQREAVDQ